MRDLTPEQWLDVAAGIAFITLGLIVVAARRRHPPALAFAIFAVGGGAAYVVLGAFETATRLLIPVALFAGILVVWGLGGSMLAAVFPSRLGRRDAVDVGLAMGLGLAFTILYMTQEIFRWETSPAENFALLGAFTLLETGFAFASFIFPLRVFRLAGPDAAAARSMGIFAIGFALFGAATIGGLIRTARGEVPPLRGILDVVWVLTPIVLWVRATRGEHPRLARNVAVTLVVVTVGSLLLSMSPAADYGYPVNRVVGVLLLAYAVLRGQLPGLDLKVRFAISKSTIAAVFIAVFFITSEVAQQFFSARTSSTYIGIGIAGTLVFAMAPMQRMAEKLAEKAVPLAPAATARISGGAGKEEAYRNALRFALRDRSLTAKERVQLAHLADELGLSARRAAELEADIVQGER